MFRQWLESCEASTADMVQAIHEREARREVVMHGIMCVEQLVQFVLEPLQHTINADVLGDSVRKQCAHNCLVSFSLREF